MTKEEYTPFGEEWKKEVSKCSKAQLVFMFRNVCIENIKLREGKTRPSALDLIAQEREKQISKGHTPENDAKAYSMYNIPIIAKNLSCAYWQNVPDGWDSKYWDKLCGLPYKDRIRIAATLFAAELDRILYLEQKEVNNASR